jgi:hypothetical protein
MRWRKLAVALACVAGAATVGASPASADDGQHFCPENGTPVSHRVHSLELGDVRVWACVRRVLITPSVATGVGNYYFFAHLVVCAETCADAVRYEGYHEIVDHTRYECVGDACVPIPQYLVSVGDSDVWVAGQKVM